LIIGSGVLCYHGVKLAHHTYRQIFPDVSVVKRMYPVAKGKEGKQNLYRFQSLRPADWKSLKQIPKHVVAAVLMAEDSAFFQHHGYDSEAIRAAWEHNHRPGVKVKRGGSTITQQVVKNLFLSPEKTMIRKIRELLLAVELERTTSKARILEVYLNIAEWGPGVYGIEQAAHRYFNKPSVLLLPREAATLAFMLPNPTKYQHSLREEGLSDFASRQVSVILERMWRTGNISDEEYRTVGAPANDESDAEITTAGASDTLPSEYDGDSSL
jgi:monofunctional biosynthetic peptidoglycan transglycosylase